jgi:hypothetical protein
MRARRPGPIAVLTALLALMATQTTATAQQRSLPPKIDADPGVARVDGRKVSLEEKAVREEKARLDAIRLDWLRQLQAMRPNLGSAKDDVRGGSLDQFAAIRDPLAVPALVRVLGRDNATCRILLVRTLAQIPGPEASDALLAALLVEDEPEVRSVMADLLATRNDGEVHGRLMRMVHGADPVAIARAARALADMEVRDAVPTLVATLVKVQRRPTMLPASTPNVPDVVPGIASGVGPTLGVVTGPVVGPGVVAYGATGVPLYPTPDLFNVPARRGPTIRYVTMIQRRPEVLEALVRLTGQDFGYDQVAWRNWLRVGFRAEPMPPRVVPQP